MANVRKVSTTAGTRWRVDYYDINGKRKRKFFKDGKSARDFKSTVDYKKSRIRAGIDAPMQPNLKFDDMKDEYLRIVDGQKKLKTIAREETVFRTLRLFIPNERIRSISPSIIRQYVKYRVDDCKVSTATVNTELRTLKTFFNVLLAHEYVQVNPIMSVKMLPVERKEPRSLSDDEVKKLLKKVNDPNYMDLIQMFLHTGARRAELLPEALTWDNVDFAARKVLLHGKLDKERILPLDNKAFDILHRRKFIEKRKYPFDFNYDYMFKKIKKYFVDAKIPDGTIHALRRTFGSKLVQQGVDIYVVSKLLGHSSIKVTEAHYIHLLDSNLIDGVSILDDMW